MSLHNQRMKCPACTSTQINKNGRRGAKQSYRCKACGRQFVESYSSRGYSNDAKQICLNLHRHGMGFRAIERATGVSHNTVINWVREEASMPLAVAEPIEATALETLQALSEESLLALQPVEGWLTYVRRNIHVSYRFSFLHLVAHTMTSLCSTLKRSKNCQQLTENYSLLMEVT